MMTLDARIIVKIVASAPNFIAHGLYLAARWFGLELGISAELDERTETEVADRMKVERIIERSRFL